MSPEAKWPRRAVAARQGRLPCVVRRHRLLKPRTAMASGFGIAVLLRQMGGQQAERFGLRLPSIRLFHKLRVAAGFVEAPLSGQSCGQVGPCLDPETGIERLWADHERFCRAVTWA